MFELCVLFNVISIRIIIFREVFLDDVDMIFKIWVFDMFS